MFEYYKMFVMMLVCMILAFMMLSISYMIKAKNYNWEKMSAYECGFQSFEDSRHSFDVKFYLVAMLFIMFDLEMAYLFPWGLSMDELNLEGMMSMMMFLFMLTVGFIYEWKKGALDWY